MNINNLAFSLIRKERFLGKTLMYGQSTCRYVRIATPDKKWKYPVHEIWNTNGKPIALTGSILHANIKSIKFFVDKINTYSSVYGNHLISNKNNAFYKIILYPPAKFIQLFIVKSGYKDGLYGFVHALLMSFHSFLSHSKAYLHE
jgi:hypothetical protein